MRSVNHRRFSPREVEQQYWGATAHNYVRDFWDFAGRVQSARQWRLDRKTVRNPLGKLGVLALIQRLDVLTEVI